MVSLPRHPPEHGFALSPGLADTALLTSSDGSGVGVLLRESDDSVPGVQPALNMAVGNHEQKAIHFGNITKAKNKPESQWSDEGNVGQGS